MRRRWWLIALSLALLAACVGWLCWTERELVEDLQTAQLFRCHEPGGPHPCRDRGTCRDLFETAE